MKVPNLDSAVVPESKIAGYLLSTTHRDGRHKARFFMEFGFLAGDWKTLAGVLLKHAEDHELAKTESTAFGTRYVVEGTIRTPSGRLPSIRSVWFVETGDNSPRFVTAYPLGGTDDD